MFLNDLKKTDTVMYKKMRPDTSVWWHDKHSMGEAMTNMYFWHPAYNNYPVVGVSHEQAEEYCKWLTAKYMKEPNRKYKNVVFRLPNLYQWDWAAKGGVADSPFPWGGPYIRNAKGKMLANFMHIPETAIRRDKDTGKLELIHKQTVSASELEYNLDITCHVFSYRPNGYGLYNMAGNVAEYISDVGITKGGSWRDPAYYLQTWAEQPYADTLSVSDKVGFRISMRVKQ
jgi:formylglycine-generating enzyme required for sulfatase activity